MSTPGIVIRSMDSSHFTIKSYLNFLEPEPKMVEWLNISRSFKLILINIMRFLLFIILLSFTFNLQAQKVGIFNYEESKTMEDAWGRPIRPQTTYKIEGTPFFQDSYHAARIVFSNGKYNSGVSAKLNMYDNTIIFQDVNGFELELVIPVISIEFRDSLSGSVAYFRKFHKSEGLDEKILYQVIDTGRITLLKHHFVNYRDFAPYGTAVITRTFEQKPVFYFIKEGKVLKAGKNNEILYSLINDQKQLVDEFLRKNNIKLKSELDITTVIQFYNSLYSDQSKQPY